MVFKGFFDKILKISDIIFNNKDTIVFVITFKDIAHLFLLFALITFI